MSEPGHGGLGPQDRINIRNEEIYRQSIREELEEQRSRSGRLVRMLKAIDNSKLILLVAGFVLTTFVGLKLNSAVQAASWQRDKRFEVLRFRFEQAATFLDNLGNAINQRKTGLNRLRALGASPERGAFDRNWERYYDPVLTWNEALQANRGKLVLYVGDTLANRFHDSTDSRALTAVHGGFVRTHEAFTQFRTCVLRDCPQNERVRLFDTAVANLDRLNSVSDHFILDLTNNLYRSLSRLESVTFETDKPRSAAGNR